MTNLAAFIDTVHVGPELASQPLHPTKTLPKAGAAVSVTTVFQSSLAEQLVPQSICSALDGLDVDVTVPRPSVPLLTVSVKRCRTKLAVTTSRRSSSP